MKYWYVFLVVLLIVGCGAKPMSLDQAKVKCTGSTDPHCWRDLGEKSLNVDMCNPSLYPAGREEAGAKCAQTIAAALGDERLCNHPAITGNTGSDVSVETCRNAVAGKKQKCGVTGIPCCYPRTCLDDTDYCDEYYRCSDRNPVPSVPGDSAPGGSLG